MVIDKAIKIVVLGTGGTIAGAAATASDHTGYTAAQIGIGQLLASVPGLANPALTIQAEQIAQIDSKDMDFAVWIRLAARLSQLLLEPDVLGIVITHGTDTLEETAYFLHDLLHPVKPVVLTCAMRPATALAPDGPQNILDALAVAAEPGAAGVMAVCAGVIHAALHVQKVHTQRLDAFSSGDQGPVGYVEDNRIRLATHWPLEESGRAQTAIKSIANLPDPLAWPRVEIVLSCAGASAALVEALLGHGVQGIVVAATGNGTIHHALEAALLKAQAAGVSIVRATRCIDGRVLPKVGDAFADSQGLSPVKARIALMLSLIRRRAAATEN